MTSTRTTNVLLTIVAAFLGVIALRPFVFSPRVSAQSSASMQIPVGLEVISPQAVLGGAVLGPASATAQGLVLFDQASGNVWGYPMYTTTVNVVSPAGTTAKITPAFGPPTLYGTFNGPGQAMSPPPAQP